MENSETLIPFLSLLHVPHQPLVKNLSPIKLGNTKVMALKPGRQNDCGFDQVSVIFLAIFICDELKIMTQHMGFSFFFKKRMLICVENNY